MTKMNSKEPRRNTPSEKGRNNDPQVRDESAAQPGISTVSGSDNDDANQELTETAKDDFSNDRKDTGADRKFDEVGDD